VLRASIASASGKFELAFVIVTGDADPDGITVMKNVSLTPAVNQSMSQKTPLLSKSRPALPGRPEDSNPTDAG